jgi:hypothetical protein
MAKFSTSPHDIATSPYDGAEISTSPRDERRHHTPLATSPHVPKEEPIKKNPEEIREPSAHSRLMDFLSLKIGHIPNGAKEGKAVKWLISHGYDPVQCEDCYEFLAAETWRTSAVTWTTVQSNIGSWLARRNNGTNKPNGYQTANERRAASFRGLLSVVEELRDESSGAVDEVVRRKSITS